jgi:ribosome-associated protein
MKKKVNFLILAREAAQVADDKKGKDIVILNVKRLTAMADYLVLVTAESSPQMNAILDTIHKTFKEEHDLAPIHREGRSSTHWAVIDYGGLVIHVMSTQAREFYALDKVWSEARRIK